MKKLLIILLSISLFSSCFDNKSDNSESQQIVTKEVLSESQHIIQKRILIDELINKGTEINPLMYYNSKLFNGVAFDVNANGVEYVESEFQNGRLNGLKKIWYTHIDGYKTHVKFEANYKDNIRVGLSRTWHECCDGQIRYEDIYKENEKHVTRKIWSENGMELRTDIFQNDKFLKRLRPSLNVQETLENGLIDGVWKIFYDNGQLKKETKFKNGHAFAVGCYDEKGNGQLCHYIKSEYGRKYETGIWEIYYPNGQLKRKSTFQDGKLLDPDCFDEYGNSIPCQWYKTELTFYQKYYDVDGVIRMDKVPPLKGVDIAKEVIE